MRPYRFTLALFLLLELPLPASFLGQTAGSSGGDDLAEIKRQCDARNKALGGALDDSGDALSKFDAMLGAVESEAKKEPELATAAAGAPPAKAIEEARTKRDSAQHYVELAKGLQSHAAQELSQAEKEPDPARKMEHYQRALKDMDQGKALAEHAVSGMKEHTTEQRPLAFSSRTYDQLTSMAQALGDNNPNSHLSTLDQSFAGAAKRADETVTRARNTAFFSGAPPAYSNGSVILQDGHKVDVSAIEHAAASVQPTPEHRSLMREVPSPLGGTSYVVDPEVVNRARAADPKVGGVALQVSLLELNAAGVSGFQSNASLEGVDRTVAFSLRRLLTRVQPAASEGQRWASLPAELRFPGGIERIIGYVLDPTRGDVILVGVPAKRPQARMDLDAIVLGLRTSWKDNTSAYVSLDPSPLDPFGPQLSRVGGVPNDSVMARIMLDADYMMKQIMLGTWRTEVPGFRTAVQLKQTDPELLTRPWHVRFWFYPKPLSRYSVAESSSGRTIAFNAELQVLTEQTETQAGTFVAGGTGNDVEGEAALGFTRALDAFSASAKTDPDALLTRLRGLTGIVTLGALLRRAGVDYPVLKEFTALPYRHLEGSEAAPKQYAGVVTEFDYRAQNRLWRISIGGGVALVPRPPHNSPESGVDLLAAQLEPVVDRGELLDRDTIDQSMPVVLARTDAGMTDQRADTLLDQGSAAFRKGQFEQAAQEFRDAADIDPSSIDAFVNLAFSLFRAGHGQEAVKAIRTALLLDPEDHAAQLMEFAIRRSDRSWPGPENRRKMERELLSLYTSNARTTLLQNQEQAYAWAKDAIEIGPEEAAIEAYLIRGFAGLKRAPRAQEEACADLHTAWDGTEYVETSGGSYDNDDRIHALASLGLAQCAVWQQAEALKNGEPGPSLFRSVAADVKQTIDYMKPVEKLYPDLSLVFSAALGLENIRYSLLKLEYIPEAKQREELRLSALGEDLIRRFPESADAYSSVGQLYLDFDDPERAGATCSRWLAIRPHDTACLTIRGTAFAHSGRCAEARQDLSSARKDPEFTSLPGEFKSRCGDL